MPRHTPIYSQLEKKGRLLGETADGSTLRKPGRLLRWILLLVLLGLLFFGIQNAYPALTGSDLFRLEQISVIGNRRLIQGKVTAKSGLEIGENLFEVDLGTATKKLLLCRAPEALVVSVEERRPVALVSTSEGLYGLDREGTLVPLPRVSLDLPVITGVEAVVSYSAGLRQPELLSPLVHFLEPLGARAPAFLNDISEVHIQSSDEARVYMVGDGLELRMRFEDADLQAQNFQAYLATGACQSQAPAYVDLRFSGQVVVGKR